ncbi:hypothetical protein KVV02_006531 [Mortierella alpina]|uniref:Cardiolipin synthase n=1 Tax=Mortierella alpina TaxID=64518 RepID=A0A9P8D191_MORAP|nr:hypothetical protein KVV02_006531 [Mortierella alpina]
MASRSTWGLVQRLYVQPASCQARIRSLHSFWCAAPMTPKTTAFSKRLYFNSSTPLSLTRHRPVYETSWQRIPTTSRKGLIGVQTCLFSTNKDSKDSQDSKDPSLAGAEQGKELDSLKGKDIKKILVHENIYTIPNFLTFSRLLAAPVIGYWVLKGNYTDACILFGVASITDGVRFDRFRRCAMEPPPPSQYFQLDGWIARRFNMRSIVGTILDPMADKTLMTILTVTLAMQNLIPIPIAGIILGRDAGLVLASFYYRYISLPEPKTFTRYWDFSIPSAEVRPTMISKVNTVIQMGYICLSLMAPVFDFTGHIGLEYLGYTCAATTIWSGASYVYTKDAVRILHPPKK